MKQLFLIALGGGLGTISRYWVSNKLQLLLNQLFPCGTLFVNLSGSFMIGFLFYLFELIPADQNIKSFLFIGFLGAYTTFSTYSLETIRLFQDGQLKMGLSNMLLNNILGLLMLVGGLLSARLIFQLIQQN
jgi:fluoride exporter